MNQAIVVVAWNITLMQLNKLGKEVSVRRL